MRSRLVPAIALVPGLAASAIAATVMGTPALRPPAGGRTRCFVSNVSTTKTVTFRLTQLKFDGTVILGPTQSTLAPGNSLGFFVPFGTDDQAHCVLEVLSGGKIARLGIVAENSTGALVGTMNGN